MNDFAGQIRASVRVTLVFLSLCFLIGALVVSIRPYAIGLALGAFVSLLNGLYLAWKVHRLGETAAEKSGKRVSVGFLSRGVMAVLGVMVSQKLGLSLIATVIGLFFFQLATLLLGLYMLRRKPQ